MSLRAWLPKAEWMAASPPTSLRRRCAVSDVADVLEANPALLAREAHGLRRHGPLGDRSGDRWPSSVIDAQDLGIDPRATLPRRLVLLEDETARALAHHEAVPVLVEGPAGRRGVVVPLRKSPQGAKPAYPQGRDGRLRAAANHHVGFPVPDGAKSQANRMPARGARGHDAVVHALDPVADGDLPRRRVDHQFRDEEGAHAAKSLLEAAPVVASIS